MGRGTAHGELEDYGPHFEALAREWVTRHGRVEAGPDVGLVGQTAVACREHKTSHESM